jgi:hypothetical protein
MNPVYLETQIRCPQLPERWPTAFAILTGYATTGEAWSPERNAAADQAMQRDLGERFLQDALYYVQGDTLAVSYCDERRALIEIGSFRNRVHSP